MVAAPNFSGSLLATPGTFDLADHLGSFVVIGFMGIPWCSPCRFELPEMQVVADEYEANPSNPPVTFITVNEPNFDTDADYVQWVTDEGVTIPAVHNEDIHTAYGVGAFPTTIVVDPDGEIVGTHVGGMDATGIRDFLDASTAPAPGANESSLSAVDAIAVDPNEQPLDLSELLFGWLFGRPDITDPKPRPEPRPDPRHRRLAHSLALAGQGRALGGPAGAAIERAALAEAEIQVQALHRRSTKEVELSAKFGTSAWFEPAPNTDATPNGTRAPI